MQSAFGSIKNSFFLKNTNDFDREMMWDLRSSVASQESEFN